MAVTGIVVNQRLGVRRSDVRRLRAILHNAKKAGLAAQNRTGVSSFAARLRGQIEFVRMVNERQAAPLLAALAEVSGD